MPAADSSLDPKHLFGGLAGARGLIAAVSGGPDSTALMILLARWPARPPTLVVTIDHGLRPEAAGEALLVADNAGRLGLSCRIMRAAAWDRRGNLQDWARRTRYSLLAAAAVAAGFDTIVTAHHQDDQAETFLMRLARGSGVYGLGAMAMEGGMAGLRLVRPLLNVPRESLAEVVAVSRLAAAADASNSDERFDRVRMRGLMPSLAAHGLTSAKLAATAGRLKRAGDALDHYAQSLLVDHFHSDAFGRVVGGASALGEAPEEIGLRALALLVTAVGGAEYSPRLERIERLYAAIRQFGDGGFRRTLHGANIAVADGRLSASREWGRQGPPAQDVAGGEILLWDRRFQIHVPSAGGGTAIGPLGRAARRLTSASVDRNTMRTLPGLYLKDNLVAVPVAVAAADSGTPLGHLPVECVIAARLGLPPATAA